VLIASVDVQYGATRGARAAVVAFTPWSAETPTEQHVVQIADVDPYEPGAFYKRELPCIRAALASLTSRPTVVIVDAHAWLAPGVAGLGARLLHADPSIATVVGVAKTRFKGAPATPIVRGRSTAPLWVDEAGERLDAARRVAEMHGPYRVPALLRLVDQLARA
jgi:deoxyribonuclease V